MSRLVQELRDIATKKAANANYSRASYCAGRAGCDDLRNLRDEPKDYLEWKAADEIERLERAIEQIGEKK
jgi:hypothetical protein